MFHNTIGMSYPWFSSTMYHINCSISRDESFDKFGLNLNVTNEICTIDKPLILSNGAITFLCLENTYVIG